jgi:hypothetical protein
MKNSEFWDGICIWLAHRTPRRLAYWVYVVVHNNAHREAGNKTPDEVTVFEAMKAWAKSPTGSY